MAFETAFLYFFILAMLRWSGKRSVGNMAPFDFVVIIMASEAAALALEEQKNLLHAIVPITVLVVLEAIVALLSMRNRAVERVTQGTASKLVQGGRINYDAMRKERMSLVDLKSLLRDKNVDDLSTVQEARLEPSGRLTVTLYPAERPLTPKTAGPLLEQHILPKLDERLAAMEARLLARLQEAVSGADEPRRFEGRPARPDAPPDCDDGQPARGLELPLPLSELASVDGAARPDARHTSRRPGHH